MAIERTAEEKKYWWNYGKLGQELAEDDILDTSGSSLWLKKGFRLKKGWSLVDSHKPQIRFSNLDPVRHVDIIVATASKEIRAICEVKATSSASRHDFRVHGECALVLRRAREAGIPIDLAVVRLKVAPPKSIAAELGFNQYLDHLRGNPAEYSIEFHEDGQFEGSW